MVVLAGEAIVGIRGLSNCLLFLWSPWRRGGAGPYLHYIARGWLECIGARRWVCVWRVWKCLTVLGQGASRDGTVVGVYGGHGQRKEAGKK